MTNVKERTREIVEEGKAQRGNFEPEGAPLRLYEYWLSRSNSKRAKDVRTNQTRENFCHFWRVVMFWAPFMAFRRGAWKVVDSKWFQYPLLGVAGAIAIAFLVITGSIMLVAGGVGIALYLIAGFVAGIFGGWEGFHRADNPKQRDIPHIVVTGLTAPVSLPAAGIARGIREWPREWNEPALKVLLGTLAVGAGGLTIWTLIEGTMSVGWWFVPAIIAGLIGVVGIGVGFAALGDFLKGRRVVAARKRAEREREEDNAKWQAIQDGTWVAPEPKKNPEIPEWLKKVGRVFGGVADFIVLYSQVVRVNKWKICPLVEVPSAKANAVAFSEIDEDSPWY